MSHRGSSVKVSWRKGNLKSFSPVDFAAIAFNIWFPRLENPSFNSQGQREN